MKNKEDVTETLRMILSFYDTYREMNISKEESIRRTLENYDDFYEWIYELNKE